MSAIGRPLVKWIALLVLMLIGTGEAFAQCTAKIGTSSNIKNGCEPLTIQFLDNSTGAVSSRTWNFGDKSATSTVQDPNHTFRAGLNADTSYVVTLTTQCIGGGSSTTTDTIRVFKKPAVDFAASKNTVCAISDSTCFINLSTASKGSAYQWLFFDSYASIDQSPCHTYTTGGKYGVSLTVTNLNGCVNSLKKDSFINVISAPNPDFNMSPLLSCGPKTINITNTSSSSVGQISSWVWNFGDGSPNFFAANPLTHNYNNPGTYYISLQTTNSLGCGNTTKKAIVVRALPKATFTISSPTACSFAPIVVNATSTNGPHAVYSWNFNGGSAKQDTGKGPLNINWSIAGVKQVALIVTDSTCADTAILP